MDFIQRFVTNPALQRIVNTKQLSAMFGWLANRRLPKAVLHPIIRNFMLANKVSLEAFDFDIAQAKTFNQFFTRKFKTGARTFEGEIAVPCEGFCSMHGEIMLGKLYQVKGKHYLLESLVSDVGTFSRGSYATFYLSPADYHGVHAPFDCTLTGVHYIAGALHSVNAKNIATKENVYCTNERIVLSGVSAFGSFYMVLVGAVIVGKIKLHIVKDCSPGYCNKNMHIKCNQGDALAMFELGSTVILVMDTDELTDLPFKEYEKVKLGQNLC